MDTRKIKWLLLVTLCFFLAFPVAVAAFITTHYSSDVAMTSISLEAEGRIGDRSGTQTYELDIGPTTVYPVQTAQYDWPNGTPVPFTLSYDNINNLVSFTVGSNTLTYTPAQMSIDVFVRTRAVYTNTSIVVDNLVLNDTPVGDSSNTYTPGSSGIDILQISGATLSNGFTLTGQSTMTWTGSPPPWSKLAFQIKVAKGKADLAITKTDSPDPVNVGQNLTYTLNIINNGPCQANGVIVTDTLPAGVTFVSSASSQGSCSGTGTVTCSLGSLANGANATVTIVVMPTTVGTIKNSASVSSADYDKQPSNNIASNIYTKVNPAPLISYSDLSISKSDFPDPLLVGDSLLYTITVTNNGPDNATGVTVTDTLPAGAILLSATPSQGSCSGTGTVTCSLGNLLNSDSATVLIMVTPTTAGTIYNSASVTGNENDPNNTDNTTPLIPTTVNNLPSSVDADMSVTKADSPDPVALPGDPLTYTITVTNNGPSTATGVTLSDVLHSSLTFVSATSTQGSCSQASGTVTCNNIGTMANGATVTVTVNTLTSVEGMVDNTATVSASQYDPNSANNTGYETTNVGDVSRIIYLSTRSKVETGDNRMIGGFIVEGSLPKTLLIRARGPSMSGAPFNITGTLANPYLRLFSHTQGIYIAQNDNWGDQSDTLCSSSGYVCGNDADILATSQDPCQPNDGQTVAPNNCSLESAILITVPPGKYSAIVSGVNNGTGVGLVQISDIDTSTLPKLSYISTRSRVLTGFDRMIGGFIIGSGNGSKKILIRGRGPSMSGAPSNVSGTLANPYIRLFSHDLGVYIAQNDNWGDQSDTLCSSSGFVCESAAAVTATGLDPCQPNEGQTVPPNNCSVESAILITVPPGRYSAVMSGVNNGTGVGLIQILDMVQ